MNKQSCFTDNTKNAFYTKGENMKKRSKIVVSALACLCSICLMMFGVYASINPSVNINGQVSYSVHDAKVLVQGKINGTKDYPTTVDYKQPADVNNLTASDKLTNSQNQFLNFTTGASLQNDTTDNLGTWNFGSLNFYEDQNGIKTVTISLKVTNLSLYPVKATLTPDLTNTTYSNVRYAASATELYLSDYKALNVSASEGEFNVDFDVVDDSQNAYINNISIILKIEKAAALTPTLDPTQVSYTYNEDLYNAYSAMASYGVVGQTSPQGVAKYYQAEILQAATGEIVIPATYDDGVHGELPVIPGRTKALAEALSSNDMQKMYVAGVTKVTLMSGITETENLAFAGLANMTQISIPSTTIYHQGGTFAMSGLTSISLPKGTENLPQYRIDTYSNIGMFYDCASLASVNLPDTIKNIGLSAFNSCDSLQSIFIPMSVTTIQSYAFGYNKLTSIEVSSQNAKFSSPSGSNCIIDKTTNKLVVGCSTTVIPSFVTVIGGAAFCGVDLDTITIPASVTSLCQEAFIGDSPSTINKIIFEGVISSIDDGDPDSASIVEMPSLSGKNVTYVEFKSSTPPTPALLQCFRYSTTSITIPSGSKQAYITAISNIVNIDEDGINVLTSLLVEK